MSDFDKQEPMDHDQKKRLANAIVSKHGDHDDLHKPGPVVGGSKLKNLRVEFADNGYSVHHTPHTEPAEGGDGSGPSPVVDREAHHVFDSHEAATEHIGNLLKGHHGK